MAALRRSLCLARRVERPVQQRRDQGNHSILPPCSSSRCFPAVMLALSLEARLLGLDDICKGADTWRGALQAMIWQSHLCPQHHSSGLAASPACGAPCRLLSLADTIAMRGFQWQDLRQLVARLCLSVTRIGLWCIFVQVQPLALPDPRPIAAVSLLERLVGFSSQQHRGTLCISCDSDALGVHSCDSQGPSVRSLIEADG